MVEYVKNKFGARFKEMRAEKGLSRRLIAAELGVSERTVCYWELCERECDFDQLIKISAFFDVSVDYLLGVSDSY